MKRFLSSFVACMVALVVFGDANAAPGVSTGRLGVQKNVMSAARMPSMPTSSIGVGAVKKINTSAPVAKDEPKTEPDTPDEPETPSKDLREKERAACMQNNIGVGNTFVWASRYSDISGYTTMIEDVENPENNTCFVRVDVKSTDPKIDLSDIPGKYFEMGRTIECGSWVDESMLEKRILDAKKNARTWATVGGAAGGAALGVSSMELFGNKLIDGAVQGQKNTKLSAQEQFVSYVMTLDQAKRNEITNYAKKMQEKCDSWSYGVKPDACNGLDVGDGAYVPYDYIANISVK